jgi:HEAT repeat protein
MRRILWVVLILMTVMAAGCKTTEEAKLQKKLQSKDPETRREAALQLGDVATTEARRLLELQQDDRDFRVREAVRESLLKIAKRTFMK